MMAAKVSNVWTPQLCSSFSSWSTVSFCIVCLTVLYEDMLASAEAWFTLISTTSCKTVRIDVFTQLQLKLAACSSVNSISSWVIHLLCFLGQRCSLILKHTTCITMGRIYSYGTERWGLQLFAHYITFQQNGRSVQTLHSSSVICNRIRPPSPTLSACVFLRIDLSPQEEGELIIEGLLNIFWGLRRPIRLQMQDDHERIRPPPSSTSWHSGCNLDSQG